MTDDELKWLDHAASRLERGTDGYDRVTARHLRALESRVLAERKQEPVAWTNQQELDYLSRDSGWKLGNMWKCRDDEDDKPIALFTHPTPDDAFVRGLKVAREFALYEATHGPNGHALSSINAAIDRAMQSGEEGK